MTDTMQKIIREPDYAGAITKLRANLAMIHSVSTIHHDASLDDLGKARALSENATQYADHLGCPITEATAFVGDMAKRLNSAEREKHRQEVEQRAAAARAKLPSRDPDPNLVGEETKKMKQSTKDAMLKVTRADFANQVAKIRADNPKLTYEQARSIYYSQNPGLYQSMRKWAEPENEFAKGRSSSAQTEVAEKVAEIRKAQPELTHAQAYTKACEETPGLMGRLLHGDR